MNLWAVLVLDSKYNVAIYGPFTTEAQAKRVKKYKKAVAEDSTIVRVVLMIGVNK